MSYKDKHIAIVGFDLEGWSSYRFVKKHHPASIVVYDDNPDIAEKLDAGVQFVHGVDANYRDYDIVFRTPGVRPDRLKNVRTLSSATIEFFKLCPAPIIGVTGTKGKGTTCSLIADILSGAGKRVHLVGNIGKPALDELPKIHPEDIVVFELSSFQLWDMKLSPGVAVILNMGVDHLDVHKDEAEYIEAKTAIAKYQKPSDTVIYFAPNKTSSAMAAKSKGKHLAYFAEGQGAWVSGEDIVLAGEKLLSINEVGLIGPHNLENICAALTAAACFVDDKQTFVKSLKSFKGLEHRLELVKEVAGVGYYNDSFATTPESAIAAAKSFKVPTVMILGGSSKGSDFKELASTLVSTNLKRALLIGGEADNIAKELNAVGVREYEKVDGDIKKIVKIASEIADEGEVVLMSPACASFDMFKNYKDRGNQFKEAVKEL